MDKAAPAVTVIIPTYDSSGTLRSAVASVLGQDLDDFELLVVGDGCSDDSGDVVASFADPRVGWVNLPNNSGGPSVPRNHGRKRARGRWIAYLGHDDLWFPWHLRFAVAAAEESEADLVSTLGVFLEPRGASTVFGLPAAVRTPAPLCPSTWIHRRDLDLDWPEHLRWGHEVWFVDRLAARGGRTHQCGELTAIKLPAPSWATYGGGGADALADLLGEVQCDPRALERRLLLEVADALTGALVLSGKSRHGLVTRVVLARLLGLWRPYRWPADVLIRRRHRWLSRRERPSPYAQQAPRG